ncbi:MAG TPA: aminoacyl--tRNA ligase-related protein [Candidatus Paceibacterota bacterium]
MRLSQLFTKTRREAPKDEVSKNAQLLVRAGFIHKEMAGVYAYLPLGLKVLKKIEQIIREEMNSIGGVELLMTTLQDAEVWKKSGRWNDEVVDNWFKTKFANGTEVGIANTHEEPITEMLSHFISSHKDFPVYVYQFQTKFRNELRVKSGIMRVREFLMKDLYSFSRTEAEFKDFYEKCATAYMEIFNRVGIGQWTYRTAASGGSFTTDLTDEFQTLSSAGEDTIYVDKNKRIAINKEIFNDENIKKLGLNKEDLIEEKAIEVGNIFPLGTKYSDAMGLKFTDEKGIQQPVIMGSYGIGLGRLMGTVAEVLSDDRGLVWPASISPFQFHLVEIEAGKPRENRAEKIYNELISRGKDVLYDDRDLRAGEKFADADLIGIPSQIIIGDKSVENIEIKNRTTGEIRVVSDEDFLEEIKKNVG